MNLIAHVDAAHWWGPAGWMYRNCTGNLAASAVWGPIGLLVGAAWERRKVIRPLHAHMERHHKAIAQIHEHLGIQEAPHE